MSGFYRMFFRPSEAVWLGIVSIIIIVSRWLGRSLYLYNTDSVLYALALDKYDVSIQQPHPPGYALYILFTKPVYWLTGDANMALIITSIIFSVLSIYAVFYLAKKIAGVKVAWVSLGLLVFAPLFWFHGQVAMNYVIELFFSAWAGLYLYQAITATTAPVRQRALLTASLILGIGGGFRPTLVIFMAPLWLWAIGREFNWRKLLINIGIIMGITLAWTVPAAYLSGGYLKFWQAIGALFFTKSGIYNFSILAPNGWDNLAQHSMWILSHLSLNFGIAGGLVLIFLISWLVPHWEKRQIDWLKFKFFTLWIVPVLLFYLLVIFTMPGYLLIILPALTILCAMALVALVDQLAMTFPWAKAKQLPLKLVLLIMIINPAVNLYVYLKPISFVEMQRPVRGSIVRSNNLWTTLATTIRQDFPYETTIIGIDRPFVSWGLQHFQYYFPEYRVYSQIIGGIYNPEYKKWFLAKNRKMSFVDSLEILSTDTKLIVLRTNWAKPEPPFNSFVLPNDLGFIAYYDLTNSDIRSLMDTMLLLGKNEAQ